MVRMCKSGGVLTALWICFLAGPSEQVDRRCETRHLDEPCVRLSHVHLRKSPKLERNWCPWSFFTLRAPSVLFLFRSSLSFCGGSLLLLVPLPWQLISPISWFGGQRSDFGCSEVTREIVSAHAGVEFESLLYVKISKTHREKKHPDIL